MAVRVVLEVAAKRSFASALDWPGWSRSGRSPDEALADLRRAFVEAVRLRVAGRDLPVPNRVRTPWQPAYAIRRSAWHAVDHAWEIEDRSA